MQTSMNIIGWVATAILIICFVPQSYKIWKSKSIEGVSKITFPMVFIGSGMWSVYGALTGAIQGFVTNFIIVLVLSVTVWYLFAKNKLLKYSLILTGITLAFSSMIILILSMTSVIDSKILSTNDAISLPIVIIAGIGTSIFYIPQMVQTIKRWNIGKVSIFTITAIVISNILWVIFWILKVLVVNDSKFSVEPHIDPGFIISVVWSALAAIFQIPTFVIYFRPKKKLV